jgi:hypothetical protein
MFIVPIIAIKRPNTDISQFWMFLERNGSHLIYLDSTPETALSATKEFLDMNDIVMKGEAIIVNDLVFVNIDLTLTDIQVFYTWQEVPVGATPVKEVWRSFLWISTVDNSDPVGVNQFMKTIQLVPPIHTVFSVISSYLKSLS